jgi:hypothetical protein
MRALVSAYATSPSGPTAEALAKSGRAAAAIRLSCEIQTTALLDFTDSGPGPSGALWR